MLAALLVYSDFFLLIIRFLMNNNLACGFIEATQGGSMLVGEWFSQQCLSPLIWISQSPCNAPATCVVAVIAQMFLAIYALFRNMNCYDINVIFLEIFLNASWARR